MVPGVICPRCHGLLMASARSCPRCGLRLSIEGETLERLLRTEGAPEARSDMVAGPIIIPGVYARPAPPEHPSNGVPDTPDWRPATEPGDGARRVEGRVSTAPPTGPLASGSELELLPGESVQYRLGALYLTNKRVVLFAPGAMRSAMVSDIDAVGTFTERASGWLLTLGLFLAALAAGALWAWIDPSVLTGFPWVPVVDSWLWALVLGAGALLCVARFFFWVRRTLFVSVKGRPLITVTVSDWSRSHLNALNSFVNAFFQVKEATGRVDRPPQ